MNNDFEGTLPPSQGSGAGYRPGGAGSILAEEWRRHLKVTMEQKKRNERIGHPQ
jgi:hypothetical protein